MLRILIFFVAALLALPVFAQQKQKLQPSGNSIDVSTLGRLQPLRPSVPPSTSSFSLRQNFTPIANLPKPVAGQPELRAHVSPDNGTPYYIAGNFAADASRSTTEQAGEYFSAVEKMLRLDDPEEELSLENTIEDGEFTHLRFQQKYRGVKVYGAEAMLHKKGNEFYLFNGRYFPTPTLADIMPSITGAEAGALALAHVAQFTEVKNLNAQELSFLAGGQTEAELAIYHPAGNAAAEVLAYHVTVAPNITHRYSYFVDAKTGEIIHHHSELCQLAHHFSSSGKCDHAHHAPPNHHSPTTNHELPPPGPETAFATDLNGQSRLINVYETGGTFFMIDASRPMFSASQSDIPDDPSGVIWTIDGQNDSPENSSFQAAHVISSNNNWNNPTAVSAHYNAGVAYEYFKNTFSRESINGSGGRIVSLINITENNGAGMDNAFWNGSAMFYGNGDQAFSPLAKSLDVAGHEMSHGVVQSTANLEYMGESGALNESFADVFGAMIDRNDWKIGEDVVNTSIFPTGALRDMENPNNGGSSLNDNGWQPDHYADRYTGQQDNGGVHINSGIVNKAFQLFATAVGKDKAEQVYYRALTQYLVKSSQFIDCRIAVVQAAQDLYGNTEKVAAENAFTDVGIGSGSGTNSQTDVGSNPGDEYVLLTEDNYNSLFISTPDGTVVADPLSTVSPLSRPSITDDGEAIVYVAEDNTIQAIIIDWQANTLQQFTLVDDPVWRQVAIAKDGTRFAALSTDNDNLLYVYDFTLEEWEVFPLFNPTTGQGGPTTGDVKYADVLEWDFTGEWVMYDALNAINTTNGTAIEYWDISFANVWDNAAFNFESPDNFFVSKLFSQLPDDVSVGNPTFSKNSDYIIAFDYIDAFNNENFLLGTNLETGDVGTIIQNDILSWPSYSPDDSQILLDAEDSFGRFIARIGLAGDKINAEGSNSFFFDERRWGIWFANGERELVGAEEVAGAFGLQVYPNPVHDQLTVEFASQKFGEAEMQLSDLMGRHLLSQKFQAENGRNKQQLSLAHLPAGQYLLRLFLPEGNVTVRVLK